MSQVRQYHYQLARDCLDGIEIAPAKGSLAEKVRDLKERIAELTRENERLKEELWIAHKDSLQWRADRNRVNQQLAERDATIEVLRAENERLKNKKCVHDLAKEFLENTSDDY